LVKVSHNEEGHLGTLRTDKWYKHHAMKIHGREEYKKKIRQLHAPAALPLDRNQSSMRQKLIPQLSRVIA
jgi:hypothetical protein